MYIVAVRQHIEPQGISSAFAHIENLARDLYRRGFQPHTPGFFIALRMTAGCDDCLLGIIL